MKLKMNIFKFGVVGLWKLVFLVFLHVIFLSCQKKSQSQVSQNVLGSSVKKESALKLKRMSEFYQLYLGRLPKPAEFRAIESLSDFKTAEKLMSLPEFKERYFLRLQSFLLGGELSKVSQLFSQNILQSFSFSGEGMELTTSLSSVGPEQQFEAVLEKLATGRHRQRPKEASYFPTRLLGDWFGENIWAGDKKVWNAYSESVNWQTKSYNELMFDMLKLLKVNK